MVRQEGDTSGDLEALLPAQRDSLVRLCAYLTGRSEVAEDLAQETLYEAWRHAHKLRDAGDAAGRDRWLAAVARNVCLRWAHRNGREQAHRVPRTETTDGSPLFGTDVETQAADFDIEIELERAELATLLDRALALLPEPTRAALVERYIHESPMAEVAARLGVSEDAVTKRIERGKLTLRRLLTTDPTLRPSAAAYGALGTPDAASEDLQGSRGWQETRIWCSRCGGRRLAGRFVVDKDSAAFALRCPNCFAEQDTPYTDLRGPALARALDGVKGYKAALTRTDRWVHDFYRGALTAGSPPCERCGAATGVYRNVPNSAAAPPGFRGAEGICIYCPACAAVRYITLAGFALGRPELQRFWRAHPRLRALPTREVELGDGGRAAVVTGFRDVSAHARVDVVLARDTYEIIAIETHTAQPPRI